MIELIELSALAWTIINSDGEHDSIERAWTAAQPNDWTPAEGVDELRIRLSEISDLLQAAGETALLEVVSAVIVYLAIHPDRRRVEHAVIGEALNRAIRRGPPGGDRRMARQATEPCSAPPTPWRARPALSQPTGRRRRTARDPGKHPLRQALPQLETDQRAAPGNRAEPRRRVRQEACR